MWTADQQIIWGDQIFNPAASRSSGAIRSTTRSGQQIVWGDQVYNPSGQQIVWGDADTSNANQIIWGDSTPDAISDPTLRPDRRRRLRRRHHRRRARSLSARRRSALPSTPHRARVDACSPCSRWSRAGSRCACPGTNAWFSISDTFFIASALLFGPAPATVDHRHRQPGDVVRVPDVAACAASCSTAARRRSRSGSARRCSSGCPASGRCSAPHVARRHAGVAAGVLRAGLLRAQFRTDRGRGCARKAHVAGRGVAVALRGRVAELFRVGVGRVPARFC